MLIIFCGLQCAITNLISAYKTLKHRNLSISLLKSSKGVNKHDFPYNILCNFSDDSIEKLRMFDCDEPESSRI